MSNYNIEKAKEDILDSIQFLKDAVKKFEGGKTIYHKQLAIQLYALSVGTYE